MESGKEKIAVIGLGYVGLPVAVTMSKVFEVVEFDFNQERFRQPLKVSDSTVEDSKEELSKSNVKFTSNLPDVGFSSFYIVTVPTSDNESNQPDLSALVSASRFVGNYLKKGDTVVYESTVIPGATRETFVPILEQASGLKMGDEFAVGYSPERINPGDMGYRFENIKKGGSASDRRALEKVANVYCSVVKAGVH